MDFEALQSAGLPIAFGSTKVVKKKAEQNKKKKNQKKRSKKAKRLGNDNAGPVAESFNYAEEFKVSEVLQEYKNPFTILWPKDERYKAEEDQEDEGEKEESFIEEKDVDKEYENDQENENDFQENDEKQSEIQNNSSTVVLHKYYQQRYDYFSLFDEGIQIDEEGWYSVTPEVIAEHIALEAKAIAETYRETEADELIVLDAFCGVGGNTIQFAKQFDRVVAVDLDAGRLEMAKHNAEIYGVADRITFIHADAFEIISKFSRSKEYKFQVVFMSPPWGGPSYLNQPTFCPKSDLFSGRGEELFQLTRQLCKRFIFFMPRQTNIYGIAEMLRDENKSKTDVENEDIDVIEDSFVVEQHWLRNRIKAISIYFY